LLAIQTGMKRLPRSCNSDNQSEVGQSQDASSKELAPLLPAWPQMKKPGHASDNDQNMGSTPNHHGQRVRPAHSASAQKKPKLARMD
jgi:hypothetical protein